MQTQEMFQFKGMRNDLGQKFVPQDYFFDVYNVNYDDIAGANKVLCPSVVSVVNQNSKIDGLFKYSYLKSIDTPTKTIQKIVKTELIVSGGNLYRNIINPELIYSGISLGKCQAAILNDKIFIVNGQDYPLIYNGLNVYQMGAPEANISKTAGVLNASYYYAITYVTAGGEEVIGTISNTVNPASKQVELNIPIGYTGTLSRKIYRTSANGTILKLLTTIADNTTLTYIDNIADSSLGAEIPAINNECPRPKYITTSTTFNLVMAGDNTFPTQVYITDTNIEVVDKANYTDVSNRGNDNTEITGLSDDYGLIIVASKKQIYFLDVSTTIPKVTITRANIGVLDGYSMVKMPSNSGFAGGVMFVASDRTIRVMNGNYADPVPTSLDNIKTENWAQPIRGILNYVLNSYSNICAEYYDYKYHLVIDSKFFIFDTRTLSWQILEFRTKTRLCLPNFITNFDNNVLYIGTQDTGNIEQMYSSTLYYSEDLPAYIVFPYWAVSEDIKFFRELHIYYLKQTELDIEIDIYVGDNINPIINGGVSEITTSVFNNNFYDKNYYGTGDIKEDYKVIYINQYGPWITFKINIPARDKIISAFNSNYFSQNYYTTEKANLNPYGNMAFIRGIRLLYDTVSNQEIAA